MGSWPRPSRGPESTGLAEIGCRNGLPSRHGCFENGAPESCRRHRPPWHPAASSLTPHGVSPPVHGPVPLFCFLGPLAGQGDESPAIASGCRHKFMTKLRALIVDDEPLSRARVRAFLLANPSVEVAGECGDGIEALAAIRSGHPDIVFLDVQMPGCNGLQMLAKLPAYERPAIIF